MNKPVVIVTGGSYMTPAASHDHYAGSHFSELVAEKLNAELVVLSNGGCSNFSVALQIEKAISWYPAPVLILTGNVPFDRIEIPLEEHIPHISIDDQIYHIKGFKSYKRNKNSKFISTAIRDFYDDFHLDHWKQAGFDVEKFIKPVHSYFDNIYNHNLKRKQDEFIIYSYYHKLHTSKIPYFICKEDISDVERLCPWLLTEKQIQRNLSRKIEILLKEDESNQSGAPYHSSRKCQKAIADLVIETYEKNIDSWR